jgi:epoxide hydrolase
MTAESITAGVRQFRIDVPEAVLADLRERLQRTRFPGEVRGSGWTYGTNLDYMRELVAYWLERFDWRTAEAGLNALPQFMARVNGLDLHFVHMRGKGPAPLPLLISHGWPGSFSEMAGIVGPLTDPATHGGDPGDAFDVVVPSLPGYGFSEQPVEAGMSPLAIGDLFAALMHDTLGYRRFGVQGGDWGAVITAGMAYRHSEMVQGLHLNMLGVRPYIGPGTPPLAEAEQAFMKQADAWRQEEAGYQAIQGTRPQTLAYGLTDSPVGLAAWIVEKFRAWSDCDGDVERSFTKDQLLTNIMIYWVTGCINSSIRLYYESRRRPLMLKQGEKITVPAGFAAFPREIGMSGAPRSWAERALNLQRWTEMPRGGHFAAMEEPELLVDDIRAFFRPLRD